MHDLCSIMHTSMTDLKHVSIYLYMKCTLNMRVIAGTSIELMKLNLHIYIFCDNHSHKRLCKTFQFPLI